MDLWIRSQDKKSLIIANEITYQQSGSVMYNGLHCEIYNGKTLLGTYETKERALEVLDEIQKLIICASYSGNLVFPTSLFYEMPEE